MLIESVLDPETPCAFLTGTEENSNILTTKVFFVAITQKGIRGQPNCPHYSTSLEVPPQYDPP